jgi:hypothetical protein
MNDVVYLRPAKAAKYWPHAGKPPHPSKIVRAITPGTKSHKRPGEYIKLRAIRDTQGWLTTVEWIEDFLAVVTLDRGGAKPQQKLIEARAEDARARLMASGW